MGCRRQALRPDCQSVVDRVARFSPDPIEYKRTRLTLFLLPVKSAGCRWSSLAFFVHWGRVVNVYEVSPSETKWEATRDAELSLWREWGVGKVDPPSEPFLTPVKSVIRSLPNFEAGCLRNLVSNGLWPAARLHEAGLVASPLCTACGLPADSTHELWRCDADKWFRDQ